MDKVERDLEKSKESREKQAKEFTRQIENERIRHEKQVSRRDKYLFLFTAWKVRGWKKVLKNVLLFFYLGIGIKNLVWTREDIPNSRTSTRKRDSEPRTWAREGWYCTHFETIDFENPRLSCPWLFLGNDRWKAWEKGAGFGIPIS